MQRCLTYPRVRATSYARKGGTVVLATGATCGYVDSSADLPTYPQALRRRLPPTRGSKRKETDPLHAILQPHSPVVTPGSTVHFTRTTQC
jgi:hypothetical protein